MCSMRIDVDHIYAATERRWKPTVGKPDIFAACSSTMPAKAKPRSVSQGVSRFAAFAQKEIPG